MLTEMCPRSFLSQEDKDERLKETAKLSRKIADQCNKQRAIEQRSGGSIGIPAVFGTDLPNVLRAVVAVLAAKALAGNLLEADTRYLSRLAALCATTASPDDLLAVREAFRKVGALRPQVYVEAGRTLDELGNITLTETAFRKLLALEPDSECDDLMQAKALVGVTGRRG